MSRRDRRSSSPRVRPVLLAAGLTALGVGAFVLRKEREHLAQSDEASRRPVQLAVPTGSPPVTYPLSDGSRVTLAPGSSLTSRGAFGDSGRILDLTGEALFEVATAPAPFVVYGAGVRVRDVSTVFAVRTMPATTGAAARVLVAVTQGDVQVTAGRWSGAVHEGRGLIADSSGGHIDLGPDAMHGGIAWTSGALLFADEPLVLVIERLERWTGLSIRSDSALHTRRLSLALERETPEVMVRRVAEALGRKAVKDGDVVVFR